MRFCVSKNNFSAWMLIPAPLDRAQDSIFGEVDQPGMGVPW